MLDSILETNDTHQLAGRPSFNDSGLRENTTKILDSLIPLRNASHADVVEYRVEIPMRYAECYAILTDGRRARLVEPRCASLATFPQ